MTFRPYPGMTFACAILFAILCWLGVWQLERLQWKLALIATVAQLELDDSCLHTVVPVERQRALVDEIVTMV